MASEARKSGESLAGAGQSALQLGQGVQRKVSAAMLPGEEIPRYSLTPEEKLAFGRLMEELDRVKEELTAAQRRVTELEHKAHEDALLPILNQRGFDRELQRTLAYVARHHTDVCLIYVDLDDFKSINDVHGHAAGDAALMHVTDILLASVRRSDVVARLGGDEFAILLHRADEAAGNAKADQLARALTSSGAVFEGKEIPVMLTAGVTQLRSNDTAETALRRADKLMYAAKTSGKCNNATRGS